MIEEVTSFHVVANRNFECFLESPEFSREYEYANESQMHAFLILENGIIGTFALNGDSILPDLGNFAIHGMKGVLLLGDANQFGM